MIVWLASYPKSGNTWLRMFLRSYFLKNETQFSLNVKGNDIFEAQTFPNIKMLKNVSVNPTKFMDIAKNWINMQELLNLNGNINFLKTHNANLTINNYPFTNTDNTIGGIYIVRDPRDVLLSFSHHLGLSHKDTLEKMLSMEHFELDESDKNIKGGYKRSILGTWSKHYLSWKSYKGRKIFFLKYEDLLENPNKKFYEILEYLKNFIPLDVSSEKIAKSINITKFENLKKLEVKQGFNEQSNNPNFFRKGKAGDWRENLDPKLSKIIEETFKNEMIELGYL